MTEPWSDRLRRLRLTAGVSQVQAARTIGVAPASVAQWESGRTKPTLDRLQPLAALYGVTLGELCGDREKTAECKINP